jgi:peptidoglycan/LPS O-acetylase OafA/YrhL
MSNNKKERLGGLQSLRGIAAFAVLFQHVTYYACTAKGIDYAPYLRIDFGRFGVQLFFVISGFVMAGCMNQGKSFLWNRALRIYPAFWLAILASFALLSNPYFGWQFDWTSALLLPSNDLNNSYRVPYWTLVYEIAFYLVTYAIVLLGGSKEFTARVCVLWLAIIVVASKYVTMNYFAPCALILVSKWNVYFIFGMLAAIYLQALKQIPAIALALVGLALWATGDAVQNVAPLGSDLMTAGAFSAALMIAIRTLRLKAAERFGDLSFGVYLMHVPVAVLVIRALIQQFPSIRLSVLWGIAMVAAFIGATAFGWVEHQMYLLLKKATRLRRPSITPTAQSEGS